MQEDELSHNEPPSGETDLEAVFYAEDYLYFYESSLHESASKEVIHFLNTEFRLQTNSKILDLACGHGRHANLLAALGHDVTGVDINQDFLEKARKDAYLQGLNVNYIRADSREYQSPGYYDHIIHLFSSFGYFSDEENEQIIRNISTSLCPGGSFCMDILNRDVFLKDYPRYGVLEKNHDLMIDRNRFDPISGRLYNNRIIIRDGKRKDTPFYLRLYNPNEIVSILSRAGLVVRSLFGGWNGKDLDEYSKRMIIIADKFH